MAATTSLLENSPRDPIGIVKSYRCRRPAGLAVSETDAQVAQSRLSSRNIVSVLLVHPNGDCHGHEAWNSAFRIRSH
jgi:hypothetical protein